MKSSVFAFGMLMYELLHRKEPYQDEDREVHFFSSTLPNAQVSEVCMIEHASCYILPSLSKERSKLHVGFLQRLHRTVSVKNSIK